MPLPFEIPGVPDAHDRGPSRPGTAAVLFREGEKYYAQAADHNEAHTIARLRSQRISDRIMKDGDRMLGADAIVDRDAGTVQCLAGQVYIGGDIHPVGEALLVAVPMMGEILVGVRTIRTIVTEIEDPTLKGLQPGTAGEGEAGAARQVISLSWGYSGDGEEGDLYSVYRLLDGTIVSQVAPPALTGVTDQIATYDRDSNGNYIVTGCQVTPLGRLGTKQSFSIGAGTANIFGYKRTRETAFRHLEEETPDLELIAGEVHSFTGPTGGTSTISVNRAPYSDIALVILVKRFTENRVRGAVPGGFDELTFSSAFQIEGISQGGAPIAAAAYSLVNGQVSWGNAGTEPLAGSTYSVTYLHNASVVPQNQNGVTLDVEGGVNGQPAVITYNSKVPRIDALCLDISGRPVYRKGISARVGALPPPIPADLLKLAEIYNDWLNVPVVANNGTPNLDKDELYGYLKLLVNMADQFSRSQAENNLQSSTLVAKGRIFTDTFADDFFRDQGAPQTAAINQGVLQLAIDNVLMQPVVTGGFTLPYVEEVIVAQPQRTSMRLINPYANYTRMPAGMKIEPPADSWVDQVTNWTSPVTQEFSAAPDRPPGTSVIDVVVNRTKERAAFLRQIDITITLEGFGIGEKLATLTFDGTDVKPAGDLTANGDGIISLTIKIPPNTPSGKRLVRATGQAESFAQAIFVGEGIIDVETMRRVTLITRAAPPPVTIIEQTIIQQTINQINQVTNPVVSDPWGGGSSDQEGQGNQSQDPLAQSFRSPTHRLMTGLNFWIAAIGDRSNGIRVQLVTTANGYPTTEVMAEAFVSMATVQVGDKIEPRFALPVYLSPFKLYAFVVLTSDAVHAISISRLGDVFNVGDEQQRVSSQAYIIGDMFEGSNQATWKVIPDADLSFEIVGAKFTGSTRTVDLWTGELEEISDLLVRGAIELPTQDVGFRYELVRANGDVIALQPGQNREFAEYVSEQVTVRAVLSGTQEVSPILYPNTLIVGGRIRTTGTYVTRAFPMGAAVEAYALFAAKLPGTASVSVDIDGANDAWSTMAVETTGTLGNGWVEPKYHRAAVSAVQGRVRLTITGGPAERPLISGALRAYSR